MSLQEKTPVIKAARKPINATDGSIDEKIDILSELKVLNESSTASPSTGIITIRKENFATASFLFPSMIPVAMVDPERERPGITAHAWAIPMINASRKDIFSFVRGFE